MTRRMALVGLLGLVVKPKVPAMWSSTTPPIGFGTIEHKVLLVKYRQLGMSTTTFYDLHRNLFKDYDKYITHYV